MTSGIRHLVSGTAAILVGGFLLSQVFLTLQVGAQTPAEPLLGDDLAEALDLEPITSNVVIGCDQFAQVAESKGYCLDGKVSGFEDFFELATRLQGRVPTADERREFALKQELRELTSIGEGLNGSRIAEILAELRELGDD